MSRGDPPSLPHDVSICSVLRISVSEIICENEELSKLTKHIAINASRTRIVHVSLRCSRNSQDVRKSSSQSLRDLVAVALIYSIGSTTTEKHVNGGKTEKKALRAIAVRKVITLHHFPFSRTPA